MSMVRSCRIVVHGILTVRGTCLPALLIFLDILALAFAARVNIFQEFYCEFSSISSSVCVHSMGAMVDDGESAVWAHG